MAKKKRDFKDMKKKYDYSYTVTARLICGDCGKTVKKQERVRDGDYELDLEDEDVQEFFLRESLKDFEDDLMNGDIFVVEIFDHKKHEMEILGFLYEDEDDAGEDVGELVFCNDCGRNVLRR